MGCVFSSPVIIINPMKTSQNETKISFVQKNNNDPVNKVYTFSDGEINDISNNSPGQSQRQINKNDKDNELNFIKKYRRNF